MSRNQALKLIGLNKSSWFYRTHPRARTPHPIPAQERAHPHRLHPTERHRIHQALTDPQHAGKSTRQVFYDLFNCGIYLASLRTFHRIAADTTTNAEATAEATAAAEATADTPATTTTATTTATVAGEGASSGGAARPVTLAATAPGQIICWDTTFLPGIFVGSRFAACVCGFGFPPHYRLGGHPSGKPHRGQPVMPTGHGPRCHCWWSGVCPTFR